MAPPPLPAPFATVTRIDYYEAVTANELKRKLLRVGCTFENRSNHTAIYYRGKRSIMPRHPAHEIKAGTYRAILKQLGLNESEL
jgi:mRNA interferase HicA